MICLLRRPRRCLAVKGAGAGVLTAWCMAGAVRAVKASGSIGSFTLANEIPFMTKLRCSEEVVWIRLITAFFHEVDFVCESRVTAALPSLNLLNRPRRVLCD